MLPKRKLSRSFVSYARSYSKTVKKSQWTSVVGLEVHAQIQSETKLFSGSSTEFSSPVNTNVSPFDMATPGTLPVLNKRCVEAGVLTALALNCRVHPVSYFDRKHYFYADLPAGYQITQQRAPLASAGALEFHVFTPGVHGTPYRKSVRIKQLQLEQDSGRSLHDADRSLVDLNRAGIPLMEVVFEPDLTDGEEAAGLIKELTVILQRIGTCSCKMEEGALRVDANVSVHKEGEPLGVRTEVKNIGSVRAVAGAVKYEIDRQVRIKDKGGLILNETRAWDAGNKITVPMRDKEVQQDYRYMPEPNLPPLHLDMGHISRGGYINVDFFKNMLPEMPEQTRTKLREQFDLTTDHAIILVNDSSLLRIFEEALKVRNLKPSLLANFLINDLNTALNKLDINLESTQYSSDSLGQIVELVENSIISRNTAKLVLEEVLKDDTKQPLEIIEEKGWKQITNDAELREICQQVLDENRKTVEAFSSGKTKVFKAFLGAIASKTQNRADMARCDRILKELLKTKQ